MMIWFSRYIVSTMHASRHNVYIFEEDKKCNYNNKQQRLYNVITILAITVRCTGPINCVSWKAR